jgi:hypothetical protein
VGAIGSSIGGALSGRSREGINASPTSPKIVLPAVNKKSRRANCRSPGFVLIIMFL